MWRVKKDLRGQTTSDVKKDKKINRNVLVRDLPQL